MAATVSLPTVVVSTPMSASDTASTAPAVNAQAAAEENFAARHVAAFFEKFERDHYECQELLSHTDKHWLLSADDHRTGVGVAHSGHTGPPVEPPPGLIARMSALQDSRLILLIPAEDYNGSLDMREVHQIIRELSFGIYAFNQLPGISLEPNEDSTSICHMPPAYIDTRIGRLLTDVDAALKALWHGVWFPREKRIKFAERWHNAVDINDGDMPAGDKEARNQLLAEFLNAGMVDATTDPDYCNAYDDIAREVQGAGSSPDIEAIVEAERRYFMSRVDDIVLRIIFHQNSVNQYRNLFVVDSTWSVTSAVRDVDPDTTLSYERLDARLQLHRSALQQHLADKAIVRREINVLRLTSFLTTLLVAMRRRMKVPDIVRMLPNMTSDETRTEREVPPLVIGENFKCTNFHYPAGAYFHMHGGILIDHETPEPAEPSRSVIDCYNEIEQEASRFMARYIDSSAPYQETYPAPVKEIDGKQYFVVAVDFETYCPPGPQLPRWVLSMSQKIVELRPKRLPINEVQIHEQFKKYFGYKRAIKLRNLPHGLRMTSQRGLVAMFSTLCRKCPSSRLGKHDENGMTLMHHAAVNNRPQIITGLVHLGQDVNVRKIGTVFGAGPTPLHLAVRCGSLDAVACLLAHGANVLLTDEQGWAAVHHAAYYDQERILRMLIRRNEAMVELQAKNELKSTPLLMAASSGALSTLKCLIDLGAYVLRSDEFGNDSIHLATMRYHANVLEFFINWKQADVDVWNKLVGMLRHSDVKRKDAAVRCLELLTTTGPQYWRPLLDAGGVPALLDMLRATGGESRQLHALVTAVLCNVSEHDEVREALTSAGAAQVLVQFLDCDATLVYSVDVSSRAAVVIADLADAGDHNRALITECGGVAALVRLLDSNLEDILANAVNAIRVLCAGENPEVRNLFRLAGAIPHLVEFLSVSSDILQGGSAAAIASLAYHHRENQDAVIAEGAVGPLVNLIKGHIINSQIKSALAVEVLAFRNEQSQAAFLRQDASKALIRLLKMFSLEVKEQAALALWSLAGQTKAQQRQIAENIGIPMLIEILLRDSDKLQYVGCKGMMALGREDTEGQLRVAEQGGIQPLVRLLRVHKTSSRVVLTVIQALASLCIGVAFCANKVLQTRIAEENAISILVNLLAGNTSDELKVEVAYTLGCIVLCHTENLEQLQSTEVFSFDLVRNLLNSSIEEVRLKAGFALAIFAFNNMPQQYAIRQAGGLGLSCFEPFLLSDNEIERATAAFQIVVLARVIIDADSVELTAHGINTLVNTLSSTNDNAIIHAAGLLSSLAHTRAGLPDAMLSVGVMPLLIDRLGSNCSESVRHSCAVTLGYLTYNRTAARHLLAACRNSPGLYDRLVSNIGTSSRLSPNFVAEFERARSIGLPCLSLEINGGPPVPVLKYAKVNLQSSRIGMGNQSGNGMMTSYEPPRAFSAPAFTSSLPQPPRVKKAGTVHFGEPREHFKDKSSPRAALPELINVDQSSKFASASVGKTTTSLREGSSRSRLSSSAVSTFKTHVSSWNRK